MNTTNEDMTESIARFVIEHLVHPILGTNTCTIMIVRNDITGKDFPFASLFNNHKGEHRKAIPLLVAWMQTWLQL